MKFYSFCLCLFLLLNFSPSFQQSECESVSDPTGVSSCKGKTTSSNSSVCCYNKYNNYYGDGTECIEIKSDDAGDNEKLYDALSLISDGEYWENYTDMYNSLEVDCGSGPVIVDYINCNVTTCEDVPSPEGYSHCEYFSTDSQTCCYANDGRYGECMKIKKEDAEDKDKLKAAIEKIKNGQYWEDYTDMYDIVEVDCGSGTVYASDLIDYNVTTCEGVPSPEGYSNCEKFSTDSETCCYANDGKYGECVKIKKEDAEDKDKLKAAIEKIKNGQYWEDYFETYEKLDIDCSSEFLKGIFVALFAVFLL